VVSGHVIEEAERLDWSCRWSRTDSGRVQPDRIGGTNHSVCSLPPCRHVIGCLTVRLKVNGPASSSLPKLDLHFGQNCGVTFWQMDG
jgi:hypothetical protein